MTQQSRMKRLAIALGLLVVVVGLGFAMTNPRKRYGPQQPIRFQHRVMTAEPNWTTDAQGKAVNMGGYAVPCRYCHTMPYQGRHSTLPSTEICMNCHSTVGQDKEWVLELKKYWERGEPIPWVKVHDLPDFVYFDHSAHLNARDDQAKPKVDCVDCHGDVVNSEIVSVQSAFNMGWCIDCHRKPEMAAPLDCVVCHR